jgi:hypothetical protein
MDAKACELFTEFWNALLALDADEVAGRFEARGCVRFGGDRRAEGRPAVRREFVRLFARTAAIRHRLVSLWARDGVVVAEADLAFELDGDRHVEIPVTTVCWFRDDGIARCEFSFYPEPALLN